MPDLYVSWSEYREKIEALAAKIYHADWEFNQIICLARGGLRIGDTLSRIYRKPLAILSAAAYGGAEGRDRGEIRVSRHLSMTTETVGRRVLLVDDLVDSGLSLRTAIEWLGREHGEEVEEIRTAVLWYKAVSTFTPDFYVDYLPDNPWIHQPFEEYERMDAAQLAEENIIDCFRKIPGRKNQATDIIERGTGNIE